MRNWKKAAIGTALGLALLGGVMGTALADDPEPGTGPGWARDGARGFGMAAYGTVLAQKLGLTPQEFQAERHAGQSLAQIAESQGMTEEQLVAEILTQKKSLLDAAVGDGRMTQEQADQAYEQMEEQVAENVNRTEVGPNPSANRGECPMLGAGAGQGGRGGMADQSTRPGTGPGGRMGGGRWSSSR